MKKLFLFLGLLASLIAHAQTGPGTFVWSNGVPVHDPKTSGAKYAVNHQTYQVFEWDAADSAWVHSGWRIQTISGCLAPAYTPGKHQSHVVVNGCSELYHWNGSAWESAGGASYVAGSGISIAGGVIANTGDLSATNELQTLSLSGQSLSLSLGGGTVTLPAGVEWPLLAPDATSAAPSYSFTNATTTGMYYDGAYNFRGPVLDLRTFAATEEDAGGINIFSGNSVDRAGGNILIQSGQSTNGTGGTFEFYSGASTNGGGGSFLMQAGASNNGNGGAFTANAGDGAVGGSFLLRAGNTALDEESGGSFELRAGNSIGVSGSGGQLSVIGGDGDFIGGNVTIQGGNGASGSGGYIVLGGGIGASPALRGVVQINANGLDLPGMTTAERDAMPISPGNYRLIFNTEVGKFQGYANGTWVNLN